MPPAGYYGNVNPDLLRFIPPDAKTVLEIGCGEGALCEAYRRVNPEVEWKGVEINKDAVLVAESKGIAIIGYDAESFPPATNPWADCLIFGDVLEHLRDPWEVLKRLSRDAKPGAQVLACIPNVQHWTVIRDLLCGKWEYQGSGLLDRTHLRFFTLDSIRKMFVAAGLQVFEIVGRDLCNQSICTCKERWGFEPTNEMRAYQYVVRALKPRMIRVSNACPDGAWSPHDPETGITLDVICRDDEPLESIPKLHIHAVEAEDCCARPRIREPLAMLGTIPGVKCTADTHTQPSDVLIQQRFRSLNLSYQRSCLASNRTILVAEIDDLPEAIGIDPMCLKAVHAIQVSTEPLAEIVRQYNPNVMVFENQIAELPPMRSSNPFPGDTRVIIGFAAQNRQADWAPIMPALRRVLEPLGDERVAVYVMHDREFFDALGDEIHKTFQPFGTYDEYRKLLGRCDIALLPLEDTPFNRCKSDLKFLECAAEGVVPLMSFAACKAIDDGSCAIGMFWNSVNSFEYCLRQLIENEHNGRRLLAEKHYCYVRDNRLLSQHFRKQHAWYQSLLAAKPDLDRELLERVPELSERLVTA